MLIEANVADFPVATMCEVLGVSRSGYYDWMGRAESARAAEDRALANEIRLHMRPAAAATAARVSMPSFAPEAAGSAASVWHG